MRRKDNQHYTGSPINAAAGELCVESIGKVISHKFPINKINYLVR